AKETVTDLRVSTHLALLLLGERAWLEQDEIVRPDLADVVNAGRVSNELDLRVLEAKPPCEPLGEGRHALRVTVGVWVAQVDEIGELEDRGLRLLANPSAVANREQDDPHRHAEEDEGPRLGLRGDRGERTENQERRLVRQQSAVQGPPAGQRIASHLKRDNYIDERAADHVLHDRGDADRPRL